MGVVNRTFGQVYYSDDENRNISFSENRKRRENPKNDDFLNRLQNKEYKIYDYIDDTRIEDKIHQIYTNISQLVIRPPYITWNDQGLITPFYKILKLNNYFENLQPIKNEKSKNSLNENDLRILIDYMCIDVIAKMSTLIYHKMEKYKFVVKINDICYGHGMAAEKDANILLIKDNDIIITDETTKIENILEPIPIDLTENQKNLERLLKQNNQVKIIRQVEQRVEPENNDDVEETEHNINKDDNEKRNKRGNKGSGRRKQKKQVEKEEEEEAKESKKTNVEQKEKDKEKLKNVDI